MSLRSRFYGQFIYIALECAVLKHVLWWKKFFKQIKIYDLGIIVSYHINISIQISTFYFILILRSETNVIKPCANIHLFLNYCLFIIPPNRCIYKKHKVKKECQMNIRTSSSVWKNTCICLFRGKMCFFKDWNLNMQFEFNHTKLLRMWKYVLATRQIFFYQNIQENCSIYNTLNLFFSSNFDILHLTSKG